MYLIQLAASDIALPPPKSEPGREIRRRLGVLMKDGLLLAAREALKALWELLRGG